MIMGCIIAISCTNEDPHPQSSNLVVFQNDNGIQRLASLNSSTGQLTTIASFNDANMVSSQWVYEPVASVFVALIYKWPFEPYILTVFSDGSFVEVKMSETFLLESRNFMGLFTDGNGGIYCTQSFSEGNNKLVKLDRENGTLKVIHEIHYGIEISDNSHVIHGSMLFEPVNQEFVGLATLITLIEGSISNPFIFNITKNGTIVSKFISNDPSASSENFSDLMTDNNGNLYAYQYDTDIWKITSIDPDAGIATHISPPVQNGQYVNYQWKYNPETNSIIGLNFEGNYILFDPITEAFEYKKIQPDQIGFTGFMIK